VKGIQVCSNKWPSPLQGGDNHKNVKMGWGHSKIFFSRATGPILTNEMHFQYWKKYFYMGKGYSGERCGP
jgi:hypothetical protein